MYISCVSEKWSPQTSINDELPRHFHCSHLLSLLLSSCFGFRYQKSCSVCFSSGDSESRSFGRIFRDVRPLQGWASSDFICRQSVISPITRRPEQQYQHISMLKHRLHHVWHMMQQALAQRFLLDFSILVFSTFWYIFNLVYLNWFQNRRSFRCFLQSVIRCFMVTSRFHLFVLYTDDDSFWQQKPFWLFFLLYFFLYFFTFFFIPEKTPRSCTLDVL